MNRNSRRLRRLALVTTVVGATVAGSATAAHADAKPWIAFPSEYSNGCSFPGLNALFDQSPPLVDPSPWAAPWVFVINFRAACDMHDAGYEGGNVWDPYPRINFTQFQSRQTIDNRFYNDLINACNQKIGWNAPVARGLCYGIAGAYYGAVRAAGWALFDANPTLPGRQLTGTRPNN